MKRFALIAAVVAAAGFLPRAAEACVSGCFQFSLAFPTITCAADGFTRSGTSISNNTSNSLWFECPVPANSIVTFDSYFAQSLSINVTSGTSCFAVMGDAAGSFWSVPAPLTRNFTGFIEDDWSGPDIRGSGGRNISVECLVPPGGKGFQYFQQTSWFGK